jgi:type II secretory pathway component GspD/PulD (secretin)
MVAPIASLQAMSDRNALIIVDRAANVRRLVALIQELDKFPALKTDAP